MKLSNDSRDELRKRVDLKLSDFDFDPNARIKLPKDKLEILLFDEKVGKNNFVYKKIGFISDNLCKLDLSEISFDYVSYEDVKASKIGKQINLSNTNAKIDFSKSYDYIMYGSITITNINFENVDLSNNDFSVLAEKGDITVRSCNLRNTNISCPYGMDFAYCDLSDNEGLWNLKLRMTFFEDENFVRFDNEFNIFINNTNLANTRVKIIYDRDLTDKQKEYLSKEFISGHLDGCYFNGKLIEPRDSKKAKAKEILKEYKRFESEEINNFIHLLDGRQPHSGGRQMKLKPEEKSVEKKMRNIKNNEGDE